MERLLAPTQRAACLAGASPPLAAARPGAAGSPPGPRAHATPRAASGPPSAGRAPACHALAAPSAPPTLTWPAGFEARYELGDVLGRGSFGVVRTAFDRVSGRTVAAKIISKTRDNAEPERIAHRIQEEVSVMLAVQDCPEALQLHGVYQNAASVILVLEMCRGGTLEQFMKAQGTLTEAEAGQVVHDILRVLAACHEQGVLYADVKPANFLLAVPYPDARGLVDGLGEAPIQIRVADFGCAQRVVQGEKLHKRTGTPLYMAPELFMQYFGVESDLWALGILLYQMLSNTLPFWEEGAPRSPWAIMTGILNSEVKFDGPAWEGVSEGARDLVRRLLDRDFNSRITAQQALAHAWLREQCGEAGCVLETAVDMQPAERPAPPPA